MPPIISDGTTFVGPLGLGFTLFCCVLLFVLPRRYALCPVFALVCYMTMGQRLVLAGFDFPMIRILLLFGWSRVIIRGEYHGLKINALDTMMLGWVAVTMLAFTLLRLTPVAFVNQLGLAYNAVGAYFLFRCLVKRIDEIQQVSQILAVMIVPLAIGVIIENATGRNAFSVFGGVSPITQIRDGELRCQGPFGSPITAGSFGAVTLSWFFSLWRFGKLNRLLTVLGIVSSTTLVLLSGSSTTLLSYSCAILAICLWPLRHQMKPIRLGLLGLVVLLHFSMKAPVWYLIARVPLYASSSAYHRAFLVDNAVNHVREWWLLGTESTAHWGYLMGDVSNQFVRVGVDGGLLALAFFVGMIAVGFGAVGRIIGSPKIESPHAKFLAWALGAALFSHVVTFWGVSYWDQIVMIWYLELAFLGALLSVAAEDAKASPALTPRAWQPRRPSVQTVAVTPARLSPRRGLWNDPKTRRG